MTTTPTLQSSIQAVTAKISPLRGTDKFDRLSLHIKSKTGGVNLAAYLGDANVSEDLKIALNNDIIAVIDGGKWDALPSAPAGQAERPAAAPAAPVTAVLVTPAPARPAAPAAAPAALPAVAVVPAPAAPAAPVAGPIDPMTAAIVAAVLPHIKAALPAQQPGAAPAIDTNLIRNLVREEIATIFGAIAKSIN